MEVVYKPIDEIIPYDRNPRRNTEAVKYVAESLQNFGWKQPIVVDADGVIIAGHTRWLAAQTLGMETVPTLVADDLTPAQVKAYRLADNKVGEIATWDFDLLYEELADIDLDMTDFGFSVEDFEEPATTAPVEAQETETSVEKITITVTCKTERQAKEIWQDIEILAGNVGAEVKIKGAEI